MKFLAYIVTYAAFYSLIGFAVYFTKSAIPLLALMITPSITVITTNKGGGENNENLTK